ncbi:MAG TPA: energy transducer TonB [Alphaproteobacteria bacterium]|nr:energy transducer TonB [Alphaproteobacteria bacterium]
MRKRIVSLSSSLMCSKEVNLSNAEARAIQPSLLLAAFLSLSVHGLLASLLIPSAGKDSVKNMAMVQVIWEKKSVFSHGKAHNNKKPEKSMSVNQNRRMSLNKTPSQTRSVNYKAEILQKTSVQGHGEDQGKEISSSSKSTSKMTESRNDYQPLPEYPWICRKRRQEGKVFVDVKTNAEGHVLEVSLHKSSGHARLDKVALDAVKTWSFAEGNQQKVLILAFRLK